MVDLSVVANPRATLAARRGIIVLSSVSESGSSSSRCRSQVQMARLLTVEASARNIPARHGDHPRDLPAATDLLRPSAEEAWPDVRTSDVLCRTAPPRGSGLLPAPSRHSRSVPHVVTMTPHGGPRCARPAETAAGLGRQTSDEPERLPLDRPKPCGPGGQMSCSLFTCTASAPHPVACDELGLASSEAAFSLQTIQPFGLERCVSPTSATDSRNEHPLDCPIPVRTARRALRPLVWHELGWRFA